LRTCFVTKIICCSEKRYYLYIIKAGGNRVNTAKNKMYQVSVDYKKGRGNVFFKNFGDWQSALDFYAAQVSTHEIEPNGDAEWPGSEGTECWAGKWSDSPVTVLLTEIEVYTYFDSEAGAQDVEMELFTDLVGYLQDFGSEGDSDGTISRNGVAYASYSSRDGKLTVSIF
jgi:hypothetical protein